MKYKYIDFEIGNSDNFFEEKSEFDSIDLITSRVEPDGKVKFYYRSGRIETAESLDCEIVPCFINFDKNQSNYINAEKIVLKDICTYLFHNESISVKKLVTFIVDNYNVDKHQAELYIKGWLVMDFIRADKKQILSLNEINHSFEKSVAYYSLIAQELSVKSKKIDFLISHGGTKGTYRENLLIGEIKKYLPKKYGVSSGFIYGTSNQIDILIYDQINHIPYFNEDGIVVIDQRSVKAIIEVKTTLNEEKIKESLEIIHDSYHNIFSVPVFKAIVAFKPGFKKSKTTLSHILNFYRNAVDDIFVEPKSGEAFDDAMFRGMVRSRTLKIFGLVDCICILDNQYFEVSYPTIDKDEKENWSNPSYRYIKDDLKPNLSTSLFLKCMMSYLDVDNDHKEVNSLYGETIHKNRYLKSEEVVYKDQTARNIEMEILYKGKRDYFNHCTMVFERWRLGKAPIEHLVSNLSALEK